MDLEERFGLVSRGTVEIVTEEELRRLLQEERRLRSYVGIEPSGLLHIGQGMILAEKLRDFISAGVEAIVLLADWHAYINDKLGGNLENIQACAEYVKDCFFALGVPSKVKFRYANELVGKKEYWQNVIKVSKNTTIARIRRAMSIMGRREEDADADASKLIYPAMQVADIQALDVDIALGGMDQRHAHMLLRDLAPKLNWKGVVAVHTPILSGLQGGGRMDSYDFKMAKSKPESCIFLNDSYEEIRKKMEKAFCPEGQVQNNPVLETCQFILFNRFKEITVERDRKYGGDVTFQNYQELERAFVRKDLHPIDLKKATTEYLNEALLPVREYFEKKPENYDRIKSIVSG